MSENGRVIGGSIDEMGAQLWIDGVREPLDTPAMLGGYSVNAVSADGSVAVGWSNHALRWDSSGALDLMAEWTAIGFPGTGGGYGHANGVSPDGSIIVGYAQRPDPRPYCCDGPFLPVRWDDREPTFLQTEDFVGGMVWDLSADGIRLVGHVVASIDPQDGPRGDPDTWTAALWDADGSLRLLIVELADLGASFAGWNLLSAVAVSDDGRVVAGRGTYGGVAQGFVALLTPTVGLDVVPGSSSNFVVAHPYSRVMAALYGSDSLDVAALDLGLLRFGPAGAPVAQSFEPEDLNGDGHLDRRLIFEVPASGLVPGDTEACLTAGGARPFRVCSPVQVTAGDCGLGFEVALLLPPLMAWRRRLQTATRTA